MRTKTMMILIMLASTAIATLPVGAAGGGNCTFTNNGVMVNVGDISQDCSSHDDNSSHVQFCDQGTGAGAGAAGVGVGPGSETGDTRAGAGATAACNQEAQPPA